LHGAGFEKDIPLLVTQKTARHVGGKGVLRIVQAVQSLHEPEPQPLAHCPAHGFPE
jgi:hypothetical protein